MFVLLGIDELVLYWVIYSVKFYRRIMNILFILLNLKRSSFICIVFEFLVVVFMLFCVMVIYIFKFLVKWIYINIDKNIKFVL